MNKKLMKALGRMPDREIREELGWEAFLRYKAAYYTPLDEQFRDVFPLLTYLGMTESEYNDWIADGVISSRVKERWGR